MQVISCTSLASDINFKGNVARVMCPTHCEREASALAIGSGVHPQNAHVCLSAMVDKVMPIYGGEMLVSKAATRPSKLPGRGLESYTGAKADVAVSISATGEPGEAWQAYAIDNVDMSRSFPPEKVLNCESTLDDVGVKNVGDSVVVNCPGNCRGIGKLSGTLIYTPDSSVCRAAAFDRVIGSEGGRAVVTLRHGQEEYFASQDGSDKSTDAPGTDRSFTVALPTSDVLSRMSVKDAGFL